MSELDTVRENFYKPLDRLETAGGWLFWLVSILSFAPLFFDKISYPAQFQVLQIALLVLSILFFIQGQVQKLYFFPRAEDVRRQQLLSDSFNVSLTHERTVGYYNNEQSKPMKRLAASSMESAYFTHAVIREMLKRRRVVTLSYLALYFVALSYRSTELELLAAAAQVLFSEEIIARWLRMEWLRIRSDQVFDKLNRLFAGRQAFSTAPAQSQVIELFAFYETTKATAAILLSSRTFHKENPRLSEEWEQIRRRLDL